MAKNKSREMKYPKKLVAPIGAFLQDSLKALEKRKKSIDSDDPFKDESRLGDNASMDTDAAEQTGHIRSSVLKSQLDKKIVQTKKALTRIKLGKYGICEDCGKLIDTDRLMIYPEATFCIDCEKKRE